MCSSSPDILGDVMPSISRHLPSYLICGSKVGTLLRQVSRKRNEGLTLVQNILIKSENRYIALIFKTSSVRYIKSRIKTIEVWNFTLLPRTAKAAIIKICLIQSCNYNRFHWNMFNHLLRYLWKTSKKIANIQHCSVVCVWGGGECCAETLDSYVMG